MSKQHTAAKNGKPGFQSYKDGRRKKKTQVKQVQKIVTKPTATGFRPQAVASENHQYSCDCTSCLISKGDQENQQRINRILGYRPLRFR